ncbi:MAG: lipopolysaccharide heptosyltransferase II [Thermodesulfovibrionales bacterium]
MNQKILIRSVNWIGDAIMTLPSIRLLKKKFNSHISLLVRPSVKAVFEGNPDIDEFILYEDYYKGLIGRLRLASELRKEKFTMALLFQNAFDAALIAFLARIPERIGYSRDGRGFLLTRPVPFDNDDRRIHHIDYYLNLIRHVIGNEDLDYSNPYIYLTLEERITVRKRLEGLKRPVLGLNPGATYGAAKRWLPERFAEVAGWFIKDTGGTVIITGSVSERPIADEIIKNINPDLRSSGAVHNLAGNTTLRELILLISECDLYLSNDSGPMHIAYAVGTPLVALFGSTDPNLTGPRGEGAVVLRVDVECNPCFKRDCDRDMMCMHGIYSDDVYLALKDFVPSKRAVFFDRDGTLCEDVDYLRRWEDFKVFDDISSLNILKNKDFALIGLTNQSGIARGLVEDEFVKKVNRFFVDRYGFDDFYYCPHHPDEHCSCRKPELGMVHKARIRHNIDLKNSYVVGDKDDDMRLATAAGAKGILVRTGKGQSSSYAFKIVNNLREAVNIIIEDSNSKSGAAL